MSEPVSVVATASEMRWFLWTAVVVVVAVVGIAHGVREECDCIHA